MEADMQIQATIKTADGERTVTIPAQSLPQSLSRSIWALAAMLQADQSNEKASP